MIVDVDEGSADSIQRITHFVLDSILRNGYLSIIQLHNIYYIVVMSLTAFHIEFIPLPISCQSSV